MRINNPIPQIKYINRYNDEFTFTLVKPKEILWEGPFEYCSISYPNDYTKSYEKYLELGGEYELQEFIQRVHDYDDEKKEFVLGNDLVKLITPLENLYASVDPSGGPYIGIEEDMGRFDKIFTGKIVKEIQHHQNGYKIIIK